MANAYVLLNSDLGKDSQVQSSLNEISEVKEVYAVYGVYDFIVKLEMDTMDELKDVITNKVRRIMNLRSSLTMLVAE